MSDDDSIWSGLRQLFSPSPPSGTIGDDRDPIGGGEPVKEVRLPFDAAEHVYIKHGGEWYKVVETEDGLGIVEGDE